jgi:hypothetical protein
MQTVIPVGTVNNVNYLEDSIKQKNILSDVSWIYNPYRVPKRKKIKCH